MPFPENNYNSLTDSGYHQLQSGQQGYNNYNSTWNSMPIDPMTGLPLNVAIQQELAYFSSMGSSTTASLGTGFGGAGGASSTGTNQQQNAFEQIWNQIPKEEQEALKKKYGNKLKEAILGGKHKETKGTETTTNPDPKATENLTEEVLTTTGSGSVAAKAKGLFNSEWWSKSFYNGSTIDNGLLAKGGTARSSGYAALGTAAGWGIRELFMPDREITKGGKIVSTLGNVVALLPITGAQTVGTAMAFGGQLITKKSETA